MNTRLLVAAVLLLAGAEGVQAQAPITITQGTFPLTTSSHEYLHPGDVYGPGVTAPTVGPNQTWDYSSLRSSMPGTRTSPYGAPPAPDPAFPDAAFAELYQYSNGTNLMVSAMRYYKFTANGYQALGIALLPHRLSLAAVTGGAADSLIIPAQTFRYNDVYVTKLPMTAGSVHHSRYRIGINATITAAALGLARAPLRMVLGLQRTDSVAAWGTVRIPAPNGPGASPAFPALLRRRFQQEVDSLYLNGAPAPTALLDALEAWPYVLGKSSWGDFFRLNSAQPLVTFRFDPYAAAGPFSRIIEATYSFEPDLVVTSTRGSLAAEVGSVSAYPNPSADGRLTIRLGNETTQPVTLTVFDLAGRRLASENASTGQSTPILRGLPAGTYLLEVRNARGLRSTLKVDRQ